jgi:hypothetical protein
MGQVNITTIEGVQTLITTSDTYDKLLDSVDIENMSTEDTCMLLERVGVTVIKVINKDDIPELEDEYLETLRGFTEYTRKKSDPDLNGEGDPLVYVLGGFAALGNPSSFHNPMVRRLRREAKEAIEPVLRLYRKDDRVKLEVLFDRMMNRPPGKKPVAEMWHSDVNPPEYTLPGDVFFGGWLNTTSVDQFFSFIPGSHLGVRYSHLRGGFAQVPKKYKDNLGAVKKSFKVPPGYAVIFPQYIKHEVLAVSDNTRYTRRLFLSHRLTMDTESKIPDKLKMMRNQEVMSLPSGQNSVMYSTQHYKYKDNNTMVPIPTIPKYKITTTGWSVDSFVPEALITMAPKGKDPYQLVKMVMPSLKYLSKKNSTVKMYTPYTDEEVTMYFPVEF